MLSVVYSMKRRDFILGSATSTLLLGCGHQPMFTADMISSFESDFPFPLLRVPGIYSVEAWTHLAKDKSVSPVIIGEAENVLYLLEGMDLYEAGSVDEILLKTKTIVFPEDFQSYKKVENEKILQAIKENPAMAPLYEGLFSNSDKSINIDDVLLDWPTEKSFENILNGPSVTIDWATDKPFQEVIIALIPTSDWTEIPAYIKFGGFNECPSAEWHVAALRYWRDLYGAQLIGLSHDTLDVLVSSNPKSKEEAAKQAITLFEYCPDLVLQGTGSVSDLASETVKQKWWYLWWD